MAFTVTFRTSAPPSRPEMLAAWLTERGEAFTISGEDTVALRGLPMRLVASAAHAHLQAQLEVTSNVPLSRMVDTVFDISMRAGADVNLAGRGPVTRPELWMCLADEQDRGRIAASLRRAREHGNADDVHRRLWATLSSLRPGHDDRWDAAGERVVEMVDVGAGISLEQARWHVEDPKTGDVIPVPVAGTLHCLVWRWLSEAYPGLTEPDTLH